MRMHRNLFWRTAQDAGVDEPGFWSRIRSFTAPFWAINGLELVERAAYYGALSVLSLDLQALGYSLPAIGALVGLFLPLPYTVSLIAGPLGDKYGYRRAVFVAFALYIPGFLLLGFFHSFAAVLAGILFVGIGAGAFKPLPAASVAHTTPPESRNLGYGVYYWAINVGGFIGPVVVAVFGAHYQSAFLLCGALMAANLVLSFFAFRDPAPPQPELSPWASLRGLGSILKDRRFVALAAIYSGFWFVYSMNFSFLSLYVDRFVDLPAWFSANQQQSIDPATIMLLGIPLGAVASRSPPLRMMTLGITLFTLGFVLVGFTHGFTPFVLGLVIATIGEILTHPGYLSLVSRLAPKDKVAAYQSVGFLPIAIGFGLGPLVGGPLYEQFAKHDSNPRLFWALLSSIGFLTVGAFLLYIRIVGTEPDRKESSGRRVPGAAIAVPFLLAVVLVASGIALGPSAVLASATNHAPILTSVALGNWTGTNVEGGPRFAQNVSAPGPGNITFVLTWMDDPVPGSLPGSTNQPDTFTTEYRAHGFYLEDGATVANPVGGEGRIVEVRHAQDSANITVTIFLFQAGDVTLGPATVAQDTSNSWKLEATFTPDPTGS
jgi:dipeptide/tripeptide permease